MKNLTFPGSCKCLFDALRPGHFFVANPRDTLNYFDPRVLSFRGRDVGMSESVPVLRFPDILRLTVVRRFPKVEKFRYA